jgi:hypothetical protein
MSLGDRSKKLFVKSVEVLKLLCFHNGAIIPASTSHGYYNSSPNLLLPQQVDEDGKPCSVIPHGLAHAIFVMATLKLKETLPTNM